MLHKISIKLQFCLENKSMTMKVHIFSLVIYGLFNTTVTGAHVYYSCNIECFDMLIFLDPSIFHGSLIVIKRLLATSHWEPKVSHNKHLWVTEKMIQNQNLIVKTVTPL